MKEMTLRSIAGIPALLFWLAALVGGVVALVTIIAAKREIGSAAIAATLCAAFSAFTRARRARIHRPAFAGAGDQLPATTATRDSGADADPHRPALPEHLQRL